MPDKNDVAEMLEDRYAVELSPTQSNEVIVEKLGHLKPAFETVFYEMIRLKEDLANGKFDPIRIVKRVVARLG